MVQNSQPAVSFWLQIAEFFKDYVFYPLKNITVVNIIDILVLAILLHMVYRFIRDRHAGKTVVGLGLLIILYALSDIFGMIAINSILKNFYTVGIIAVVVLFQPELREVLEEFGATMSMNLKKITRPHYTDDEKILQMIDEVCQATFELSSKKEGALIVLERKGSVDHQMSGGTRLDAIVSHKLLCNIFINKSPLHDGAVIISKERKITWASSKSKTIASSDGVPVLKNLGTRHRAAYKICQVTDAAVVVVSEETGTISVAYDNELRRGYEENKDGEFKRNLRDELFYMIAGKNIADIETKSDTNASKKRKRTKNTEEKQESASKNGNVIEIPEESSGFEGGDDSNV